MTDNPIFYPPTEASNSGRPDSPLSFGDVQERLVEAKFEATQLERLNKQAADGSVTAEKELFKQIDRLRMRDQAQAFAPVPVVKPGKSDRLGKKEAAALAAEQVRGLYEPPPPPPRMN